METIDVEAFADKGEAIFRKIEPKLKPHHLGEIVAIEIESGDYFLGKTLSEADNKAKKKYPGKLFFFARVGARAAVSFKTDERVH